MDPRPLNFFAQACAGELLSLASARGSGAASPEETMVRRVCTDSRHVEPGDLFVALRGENFDGHEFLGQAANKGAVAAVVGREHPVVSGVGVRGAKGRSTGSPTVRRSTLDTRHPPLPLLAVAEPRQALGCMAAEYRKSFALPCIAVGGSNGKTTTKELVASVLRQKLATAWSGASFNNDIGVPLSLLQVERKHQAAVLEVGTNHPGELAPLVKMIQPNYGVITCIGREHLEFFGDLEGVAQEQGALAELLPVEGKLLVSGDDEWTGWLAERTRADVVRVGFSDANDWRVRGLQADREGVSFRVEGPLADYAGEYRIQLLGRHQVINAVYALALGVELGLSRAEIARGLAECEPAKMRLQLWDLNGVSVLDDAYNANADSVLAALQTLRDLPAKGRRVAVLGDMAELGVHSQAAHEEAGRRAAQLGADQLFAVGKMAPEMARGARNAGLNRVFEFTDVETAAAAVKSFVRRGDLLLLKASRVTRLERIAECLRRSGAPRKLSGQKR
ncbi:MAG: hypothetical protein DME25_06420 [Verrucomicrobia bacterium]|nr:MAG: hypothetical protein DME25_06420 [Verrucomicrobiota bacterium]